MTSATLRKTIFCLLLAGLLPSSFSQQRLRIDREKSRDILFRQDQVRTLDKNWIRPKQGERYRPGEVLIKFKPTLRLEVIEATIQAYGARPISKISGLEIYKLSLPEKVSVEEMVSALTQNPDVEYAEPNYKTWLAVVPNDSFFNYQYYLRNTGQKIGGSPDSPSGKSEADIKATAAWDETKGSSDVLIAIIDTGVDLLHPDLKNKIHSPGRDFVNDDFDATDDYGHGTIVASVAASETNNSQGIAGVAWNSKILPVKVIDENGEGDYEDLIAGIKWAVDNNASVINMSLGGDEPSSGLRDSLRYAHDKGVVLVAAAGNEGSSVLYPAAYDDYCLAVAATDYQDERVTFTNTNGSWESNYGREIDIAAPGQRVVGAVPTWYWGPGSSPYAFGSGTSLSSPQVAGLAALLKALKPWLTVDQIMDVIRYSADDVNSKEHKGRDNYLGYGRINMEKALVPIKIKK